MRDIKDTRTQRLKLDQGGLDGYTFHTLDDGPEIKPLGAGGSGIVYKAYQDIQGLVQAARAIKFFIYRDDIAELPKNKSSGPISTEDFRQEVKNITSFNHQFLIRVIEAGLHRVDEGDIPYIVMDFVDGPTLKHVIKGLDFSSSLSIREHLEKYPDKIIDLIIDIGSAIKHMHFKRFSHCDIAPKNIFLEFKDGVIIPILGDFGISKPLDRSTKRETVFIAGSKDWIPPSVAEKLDQEVPYRDFVALQPNWDIFAFSKVGITLVESITSAASRSWFSPLLKSLKGGACGEYSSIASLIQRIEFLRPMHRSFADIPELSSAIGSGAIKMMPVEALKTTKRLEKIINHPSLSRLLKVPQLTTPNKILPGASHTRYEHTLGVIESMRRYLLSLLDESKFLEHFTPAKIEVALLCASFLSSSRFPLSNVVHEIRSKHKELFSDFSKRSLIKDVFEIKDHYGETVLDIIEANFQDADAGNVIRILSRSSGDFDDEDQLIFSLLHSSLDVRVIDFVRRDAHHLGIISGDSFTLNDILPHVTVHNHKLALKETGVSVAEQIISLRYWLFSRVYWNRPSRAFCVMTRYMLMKLHDQTVIKDLRADLFELDQPQMLRRLLDFSRQSGDVALEDICDRLLGNKKKLYGVLYEVNRMTDPEFGFELDRIAEMDCLELDALEKFIEEKIENSIDVDRSEWAKFKPVLVDYPHEPGSEKLGADILVLSKNREPESLDKISGIVAGVNTSFLNQVTKLRVYIHPRLFPGKIDRAKYEEVAKQSIKSFVQENTNSGVAG